MESTTIDTLSSDNTFLTMEDLHNSPHSTSPAPSFDTAATGSQQSPPPVIVHSKQAKKRKSWGQELPEPKTNLPPRKRAKTDDEKEQRRIERIKRNRAAAHNSRERKRQEAETLAVQLARANAELEAYRRLHGPLPSSVVLPEVHVSTGECEPASTPAPSLVESHGSVKDAPSPASPAESIFHNTAKTPLIKQEPLDYNFTSTLPPAFDNLDSKPSTLSPLDLTQHSAAMLCDLQCRSSSQSSSTTSASWWTNLFLSLMTIQLQACYKTLLVAIWMLSPSRMARMMQASMARSSRLTNSSMTPRLLRSTRRRLARHNAATGLSAPSNGAPALQRQSLDQVRRAREELAARQARAHQTRMALLDGIKEDHQPMSDEGHESNGVGRKGSSST